MLHLYLSFSWFYLVSTWFEKQVKSLSNSDFPLWNHTFYFTTDQKVFSSTNKDVLPALQKSNVIYLFSCHCDRRYAGCNSQRLQDKIKNTFQNLSAFDILQRNTYFQLKVLLPKISICKKHRWYKLINRLKFLMLKFGIIYQGIQAEVSSN